ETEIETEAPVAKTPASVAPVVPKRPGVGAPPRFGGASPKAPESPKVKPVVPKRPGPPARKPMVEVPPLELEPDFDTGATDRGGGHEVDDQPRATDGAGWGGGGGGRPPGALDRARAGGGGGRRSTISHGQSTMRAWGGSAAAAAQGRST